MWSNKISSKHFRAKKIQSKNEKYFSRPKKKSKKNRWKSQWKFKILKFRKNSGENRNFKILNFHWLFHRIFFRGKSNFFGPTFFFDQTFSDFFRRKKIGKTIFGSPISIPNDPKIPKITLRTSCDHYKITNSEHEKKSCKRTNIAKIWAKIALTLFQTVIC